MLTYLIFNQVAINKILLIASVVLIFLGSVVLGEFGNKKLAVPTIVVGILLFIAFALLPNVEYLCYVTQQDIPQCAAR